MENTRAELEAIIRSFAIHLVEAVEKQAAEMALGAVPAAFAVAPREALPFAQASRPGTAAGTVPKRRLNLSPVALAKRKLQGKYMGALRGLQPAAQERVKKVAREKSIAEAVKFAASLK
jgi:hypothetical protein